MNRFVYFIKTHFFVVLVFVLFLIFIPVVIYLSFGTKSAAPQNQIPTINAHPTPLPLDLSQSYNNFNQLSPGKSTLSDVEKINGAAFKSTRSGNKLYLYYRTPSNDYENKILLTNGTLYYSLENVFGSYRGFYSDYTIAYGQPSLTLYNKDSADSEWFIFLKQGFGLEVGGNDITQIVYFIPQPKDSFMENIASDLNLISTLPAEGPAESVSSTGEAILAP